MVHLLRVNPCSSVAPTCSVFRGRGLEPWFLLQSPHLHGLTKKIDEAAGLPGGGEVVAVHGEAGEVGEHGGLGMADGGFQNLLERVASCGTVQHTSVMEVKASGGGWGQAGLRHLRLGCLPAWAHSRR